MKLYSKALNPRQMLKLMKVNIYLCEIKVIIIDDRLLIFI